MKRMLVFLLTVSVLFAAMTALTSCEKQPETPTPETPARQIAAEFMDRMKEAPDTSPEELARTLAELPWLPFAGASMPVEEGWLNGFDHEITGFAEGAVFSPMIGAIPFVGYVFKLNDESDVPDFVTKLKESANLRWNVCTQADELVTESAGDTVLFVMSPLSFED